LAKAANQEGFLDPWEGDEARELANELGSDLSIERIPLNAVEPKGEVSMATIATVYSEAGKVVGTVHEDEHGIRYLYKTVSGKIHFLRRPPAIAFDETVINQAIKNEVERIVVLDYDTGTSYTCTMKQFEMGALKLDRGFGKQMALPMGKWNQPEEQPNAQPALIP
jgi:hypothetical protein